MGSSPEAPHHLAPREGRGNGLLAGDAHHLATREGRGNGSSPETPII
jgi:hypothetical protein